MSDSGQAQLLVQQAMLALSQHREEDARRLARQAADLSPELESVWLVMAAVSAPQAAEVYLHKALEINPQSQRAQQGLAWVRERLAGAPEAETSSAESKLPPEAMPSVPPPEKLADTAPYPAQAVYPPPLPRQDSSHPAGRFLSVETNRLYARKVLWWPWLIFAAAVLLGIVFWMFLPPRQPVSASSQHAFRQPGEIIKPSYTPTFTPTATATPLPTRTPTPSPTPTNTATPLPTDTDIPSVAEAPEFVSALYDLPEVENNERWIDIDLSSQTLSAYTGTNLTNSFLVSTGTDAHPTVTGQFHIYVKYRYTDMSGPGYYLPDVPYTMYFYDGYGLHGTYWHHNFGTPMSHGCVNLRTEDAAWLYSWADIGTLVNVHY